MSVNRILRDKNPLLPLVRTLSEKCTWIHGHLVVANKKKDDQLYYHSCGEPCCSGWGATPELQNNNNDKIILGTPKNKIVINLQKDVYRHGGIINLVCCFQVQSISLYLQVLSICNCFFHLCWSFTSWSWH